MIKGFHLFHRFLDSNNHACTEQITLVFKFILQIQFPVSAEMSFARHKTLAALTSNLLYAHVSFVGF